MLLRLAHLSLLLALRHYLSGPIDIPTAQPGDLLKVEFLALGPLDGDEW